MISVRLKELRAVEYLLRNDIDLLDASLETELGEVLRTAASSVEDAIRDLRIAIEDAAEKGVKL